MKFTKRANGTYQVMVKTVTGKRKYLYSKSKSVLEEKVRAFYTEAEEGRKFSVIADEWWEKKYNTLAVQSVHTYERALIRAKEYFDCQIGEITPPECDKYLRSLGAQNLARKTVSNCRSVLNQILEYAVVQTREIPSNPLVSVHIPKGLHETKRHAASEEDEKNVKENNDKWLLPFFCGETGLRKGEALAIEWTDFDWENNLLYVTKSVAFDGNRPFVKPPKTEAGNRIVPITNTLREKFYPIRKQKGYVFTDDKGDLISHSYYQKMYSRYQKRTGIKATAHNLRHSFATNAFEKELSAKDVQMIIGHSQIGTTMNIYTDYRRKALKSAAEKLNS